MPNTGNSHKQLELFSSLAILYGLETTATLSANFLCKICHNFLIDICTFPCGHKFCKYCGLSWLRLESTCPICHTETYRPFSTRCYEMDSTIDDFYPLLYQFYHNLGKTDSGKIFIKQLTRNYKAKEATRSTESKMSSADSSLLGIRENECGEDVDYVENIENLRNQMMGINYKSIQICSPSVREMLRKKRRALSERKDILLAAPCTSMLQKLATLGWGTSTADQSINQGMRMLVWVVLCYVFWNFLYTFQHPWFDGGIRTFVYSCLIFVAFNLIQMQLIRSPDQGSNLLDFDLWEQGPSSNASQEYFVDIQENEEAAHGIESLHFRRGLPTMLNVARNDSAATTHSFSSESFEDCGTSNLHELEQLARWQDEGKLSFKRMMEMADAIFQAIAESNA